MRIISNFHDYYDSVMAMGMSDIVYVRRKKEVRLEKWPFPKLNCVSRRSCYYCIVGFCGKVYLGLEFWLSTTTREFCYSVEDVDKFVAKLKKKERDDYHDAKQGLNRGSIRKFFGETVAWPTDCQIPIFLVQANHDNIDAHWCSKSIVYDAALRQVQFMRIKHPYTAFQELNMWLSNLARPEKPLPKLSNDDMIESHGFDKKLSFRKPKA